VINYVKHFDNSTNSQSARRKSNMELAIIGSGVVGQATGIGFATHGHKVLFYDIDLAKMHSLRERGYQTAQSIEDSVQKSDAIFVCVPTPTVDKKVDSNHLREAAKKIGEGLKQAKKPPVVVFRSTAPPQTTRAHLIPILEAYSGLKTGSDFGVCMNPEFLREKTPLADFLNPDRIIIGESNRESGDVLVKAYDGFKCPIIRTTLDSAEMIKYASNLFLATKISFFNEIFMVCSELGLDSKLISEAVSLDKRIGKYGVYGGKPFSGMCFPKDLAAFIGFAKSKGVNPKLLEAVEEINKQMSVFDKTIK
jgi:UDPglucose 6-dehydrogenase